MTGLGLLTKRIALAGRGRSLLTILQVLVISAITLTGAVLLSALDDTQDKLIDIINNGASASLAVTPTPASFSATLAALPAELNPDPKIIDTLMPVQANGSVGTEYFMQRDFAGPAGANYEVLAGEMPRAPLDVTVSARVAARYELVVGQPIFLELDHAHPAEVVGIARQRDDYQEDFVIAAPGTWERMRPSGAVAETLAPSLDIALSLDPSETAMIQQVSILGDLSLSADVTARKPLFLRLLAEIGFPAVALAGAAVGGVLIVRLRRQVDQFTVLAAVGVHRRTVRAAVLISSLLLVVAGLLGGLVIAVGLAPLLRGPAQQVAQRQLDLSWPSVGLLTLIAGVMTVAAMAMVVVFSRVQDAVLRSGGGGRAVGESSIGSRRGSMRRGVQLSGGLLLAYLVIVGPASEPAMAAAVAATLVTLGATIPDVLRLWHLVVGGRPSALGIASRWATRERWRSGAVAVVLMTSLVAPAALLVRATSYAQTNADRGSSNILPGQVQMFAAAALTPAQIDHISSVARTAPVQLRDVISRTGEAVFLDGAVERGGVAAIDDPDDTATLWGFALDDQSKADLAAGKAVVFDPSGAGSATASLHLGQERPGTTPDRLIRVPAAQAQLVNQPAVSAVMPGAILLAKQLPAGLTVSDAAEYRYPNAAGELVAMRNAAADVEVPPSAVRGFSAVVVEPPNPGIVLATLVGAAACLLLSILLVAQAMREWRPELDQLADLGIPGTTITRTCAASALLAGLTGTALGLVGGVIVSLASVREGGATVHLPWNTLLVIAASAIAVQTVAGFLAGTAMHHGYRNRYCHPSSARRTWRRAAADQPG